MLNVDILRRKLLKPALSYTFNTVLNVMVNHQLVTNDKKETHKWMA